MPPTRLGRRSVGVGFELPRPAVLGRAARHRGDRGVLYVPTGSPTGPFDIAAASPLTNDTFYCGRIVHDRSGQPVLLAFHYYDEARQFGGELSDPMPVGWENGELKVTGP